MEVRSPPGFDGDEDGHEKEIFVADRGTGFRAIVAIHDTTMGPAGRGCRMWSCETTQAALDDVLRLPRAMAHAVDKLAVAMTISEDVGLTVDDLAIFSKETQYVVGLPEQSGDTSPPTAHGIFCGLKFSLRHGLDRESFEGVQVAIQGLGNVGFRLGEHLARADAPDRGRYGVRAGRPGEAEPAANNQRHRDCHAEALHERGILYAPDYVINGGGAINASQEKFAYDEVHIRGGVEAIEDKLNAIFERAAKDEKSLLAVANRMAEEILGRT